VASTGPNCGALKQGHKVVGTRFYSTWRRVEFKIKSFCFNHLGEFCKRLFETTRSPQAVWPQYFRAIAKESMDILDSSSPLLVLILRRVLGWR
jgi:hypothetical protein